MMKKRALTKILSNLSQAMHERPANTGNGRHDAIAMKAYELYELRGRMNGHALDDWLQAEVIVKQDRMTE